MFVEFFYHLRQRGLEVSPTEFLATLEALDFGMIGNSLERFYVIGRSLMVKRVEHYDIWDMAFAEYFEDRVVDWSQMEQLTEEVLAWLEDPKALRELTDQEREMVRHMDLDELRREFAERLREQDERHDGGSHWVGTGGTSPFGRGGEHPEGILVGQGEDGQGRGGRGAVQVAMERRFRNLRSDMKLDVRQIGMALRRLRQLTREGREDELDIEATIDATARNAGDLELEWQAPRANDVKLLLLMDVGGSMTPYARLCSRLFSAAHQATHFKQFESYYFHNCPYSSLARNMARNEWVDTREVLDQVDGSWRCIIVGDAAMAPGELMYAGGSIDLYTINKRSGLAWLREIKETIPRTVWLNPDPMRFWAGTYSTVRIQAVFEMFPLTLDGLDEAVKELRKKRVS